MRFRRRLSPDTSVNMVPMIDVVFQLIIYFMVYTTIIITPGISLILPTSTTAEPTIMSKLVITVASREEIYFNKERHTMESFSRRLSQVSAKEREEIKTVVLEGDRSISYALLVEILDALRRSGFKGINLRTRQL